jgi:two-component system sensor histidine kinase KdpD
MSIETKAHEMSEIISNVLDLMRFESGQVALRRDWQTIDDLVGSALSRLDSALANHIVDVELPPDLPAVYVDAPLITQVFANLLENAARHTPPGTKITIAARLDSDSVRIDVDDTGPGLPAGEPALLFAKFQRGRDEGNTGGAGLGLAICRSIIQAHGGTITATQRPGGGARFEFTLPATEADA